jgi:hypothetical protein
MRTLRCSYVLLLLPLVLAGGDNHIVLKPIDASSTAPARLMVFLPGGKVPNTHYINTSLAIQKASDLNLWIVIPSVTQRLCIIECSAKGKTACEPLHHSVDVAVKQAVAAGYAGTDPHFLAGHSLGGTCTNYLLQAYQDEDKYAAAMVFGSYVDETGPGSLANFSVPMLTLGAELDGGGAKPSRMTLWWNQFQEFATAQGMEKALALKPVIIVPGMDHSDFCPGFAVPGDLPSEIDQTTALSLIGSHAAAFLNLHSDQSAAVVQKANALLTASVGVTQKLLDPIIQALDMEVDGGEGLVGVVTANHSKWCEEAQKVMVGDLADRLLPIDTYFPVAPDPPPSLEHCHNNYTLDNSTTPASLKVTTCSHADYEKGTAGPNTEVNAGAHQLACKMISRERAAQQLGTGEGYTGEVKNACKLVNQAAIDRAMELVAKGAPATMARYKQKGRSICLGDDFNAPGNIGPLWVKGSIKMSDNATCLSVASLSEFSGIGSKIYPGVHYCKLLSPARVAEWIYTNSMHAPSKK